MSAAVRARERKLFRLASPRFARPTAAPQIRHRRLYFNLGGPLDYVDAPPCELVLTLTTEEAEELAVELLLVARKARRENEAKPEHEREACEVISYTLHGSGRSVRTGKAQP